MTQSGDPLVFTGRLYPVRYEIANTTEPTKSPVFRTGSHELRLVMLPPTRHPDNHLGIYINLVSGGVPCKEQAFGGKIKREQAPQPAAGTSKTGEERRSPDNTSMAGPHKATKTERKLRAGTVPGCPTTPHSIQRGGCRDPTRVSGDVGWTTDNECGIIVFATNRHFKKLRDCTVLYMDGTFKSCPRPYTQVLAIHGLFHGSCLSLVMAIMTERTIAAYRQIFTRGSAVGYPGTLR
ncbi:Hypp6207 [Branchiostoma lanceolatum]|uniref:Hypp6207 protein n=1 Tax=Branchiostoma lanceolatum TaxID=7740 RepID=A0A8J9YRW9_BRALA|nr:Hypp6207 [Branchiostoma lanceolatum]